jgi:WD40 repeat protein
MTFVNPCLAGVAADEWPGLEKVLQSFEAEWKAGGCPEPSAFVQGSGAYRQAMLFELLHVDLEYRVAAGEMACVRHYLASLPELEQLPQVVVDLLVAEYVVRKQREPALAVDAFLAPFPSFATDFRVRLDEARGASTDPKPLDETVALSAPRTAGASSLPDIPGHTLLERIGRGGMGVVYRAVHRELGRPVALKMMVAGSHADDEDLARFRTEAKAVAQLDHPNIVTIYEVGEHQGLPYLSIEYCSGGSLDKPLRESPLPARRSAELVEALARAIAVAHRQGIIHRDLKPANVLLTANGTPKITDFGLAKRLDAGAGYTQTASIVGTPSYMAPEQAAADHKLVGPAADIYALGAILYDCLTGRPPFKGATVLETLDQVREHEPVAPRQFNPSIPADLETICLKCLRKLPAKRYASAEALADDLQRWRAGQPIRARPVGQLERCAKWVRRNPAVSALLAAIVVLAAIGTAAVYVKYRQAKANEAEADKQKSEALKQAKIAKDNEEATDAALKDLRYNSALDQIHLAQAAFARNDIALAHERLNRVPPELRRWEWRYLKRQFEGGICTLYGHTFGVSGVAFSPDGGRIGTASTDGSARVWDARTGTALLTLEGDRPVSIAFSPDGARLVTGNHEGSATIWNARTAERIRVFKAHRLQVTGVAFSPDGSRIATIGADGKGRVWDATNGLPIFQLAGQAANAIAFSPDGNRLVTAGGDKTARLWDARTGRPLLVFEGSAARVSAVAFSPDGTRVVTGADENTARVWSADTGAHLIDLKGHTYVVAAVAFSPDGLRIATASFDGTAKIFDAKTGTLLLDLKGHTNAVRCLAFSPDGWRLATGSGDKTARIWDVHTGIPRAEFKGHAHLLTSTALSPDGTRLATGSWDKTAKLWNIETGEHLLNLRGHTDYVTGVAFSPDGKRVATASRDNTARLWDAQTGAPITEFRGHANWVTGIAFSPDGTQVATASRDRTAAIWDATSGKHVAEVSGTTEALTSVAFAPRGPPRIVTGCSDQTAIVWDALTGARLQILRGHALDVTCVDFSPDGSRVVTGSIDGTGKVWDAETGALLADLKGAGTISGASFNPDGNRIVTASQDRTNAGVATIWDVTTGTPLLELRGHAGNVTAAAFSADGMRIVTGGVDKTAVLWDATAYDFPLEFKGRLGFAVAASLNPAGDRAVSLAGDQTGRVWDARTGLSLFDLEGPTGNVTSVAFMPDGARIVATVDGQPAKVWDAANGRLLIGARAPSDLKPRYVSADGRYFLHFDLQRLMLVDLELTAAEREYRQTWARPRPGLHREELDKALKEGNSTATRFHLDCLLAFQPTTRPGLLAERLRLPGCDALTRARTAVHSPQLAKPPTGSFTYLTLFQPPTRLNWRTLGGLLLRDGQATHAFTALTSALAMSAHDSTPPVEEVLLALTHCELRQPDEARRCLARAEAWLNSQSAARLAALVGLPWAALGPNLSDPLDPRYRWTDWESWYEFHTLLGEARRAIEQ